MLVPVQGDAAQVQYGCCGKQHIQRGAHQTERLSVTPVACGELYRRKWHHQKSHQEVCERQGDNEVVGLLLPNI